MSQNSADFRSTSALFSKSAKTKPSRPIVLYVIFVFLVVSNIGLGLALTMGSEISQLMQRTKDPVLLAYETRILHLRMEVDRLHSQAYLQTGNLNLQLQELLEQQEILTEQHQYIQVLVEKAEQLGITTASASTQTQLLTDDVTTGSIFTRAPSPSNIQNANIEVATVRTNLTQMANSSNTIFNSLADEAQRSTTSILTELSPLGIVPTYPTANLFSVGGPFVPLQTSQSSSALAFKANQALSALETFSHVRAALNAAPVRFPLPAPNRISSAFGSRADPFGGAAAFHSGIDYPARTGTGVFTTGTGIVIFAGRRGGYGNLIEIDHGNGLISRYGHLSRILVQTGQQISAGTKIGKVGSTGRSTGPHLHFEIRRNQSAVNPQNFLNAGKTLADYIG